MRLIPCLITVIILFLFCAGGAVQGRSLKGGISLEEQHHQLELKKQKAVMSSGSGLEGGVTKQPPKPDWIKGNVYTNDRMYMYSYWQLYPLKKKFKWKIPTNKTTRMTFSDSVVKSWKGYMPAKPGKVICVPIEKGHERYRFHHRDSRGPSGYFERAGFSSNGFHRYRIWYNDTEANKKQ